VNLSEFCIRRPVFTSVMMIIMVIIGMVSYGYLTIRQYPQVEKPVVSVRTSYEGASPEIIEIQITRPLEGALAGVEGLDFMTSVSEQETSRIDLHFKPSRSLDDAASDVRDRIARVKVRLPKESDEPMIRKTDSDAEPILYLAITSDEIKPEKIFDYADKYLKDEIEALNGVANVEIYGASAYVMHIWLDPARLSAHGITANEVTDALVSQNVEVPAGRLVNKDREFMVTTSANLKTPEDFNNLILNEANGYLVRLKDVGYAEFSPYDDRSYVSLNGKQAVAIEVVKKSTANPLDLASDLLRSLPDIQASLPKGMQIQVAYDKTLYIQSSIDAVYRTIWEATALVVLVVLAFLWSPRGAFVPVITIPVSLIAAFSVMYCFGFSINTLTLLAVVLAIGLVVDDAIVMLENIYRHIEEGGHGV
jgi:multidrug efflux pump